MASVSISHNASTFCPFCGCDCDLQVGLSRIESVGQRPANPDAYYECPHCQFPFRPHGALQMTLCPTCCACIPYKTGNLDATCRRCRIAFPTRVSRRLDLLHLETDAITSPCHLSSSSSRDLTSHPIAGADTTTCIDLSSAQDVQGHPHPHTGAKPISSVHTPATYLLSSFSASPIPCFDSSNSVPPPSLRHQPAFVAPTQPLDVDCFDDDTSEADNDKDMPQLCAISPARPFPTMTRVSEARRKAEDGSSSTSTPCRGKRLFSQAGLSDNDIESMNHTENLIDDVVLVEGSLPVSSTQPVGLPNSSVLSSSMCVEDDHTRSHNGSNAVVRRVSPARKRRRQLGDVEVVDLCNSSDDDTEFVPSLGQSDNSNRNAAVHSQSHLSSTSSSSLSLPSFSSRLLKQETFTLTSNHIPSPPISSSLTASMSMSLGSTSSNVFADFDQDAAWAALLTPPCLSCGSKLSTDTAAGRCGHLFHRSCATLLVSRSDPCPECVNFGIDTAIVPTRLYVDFSMVVSQAVAARNLTCDDATSSVSTSLSSSSAILLSSDPTLTATSPASSHYEAVAIPKGLNMADEDAALSQAMEQNREKISAVERETNAIQEQTHAMVLTIEQSQPEIRGLLECLKNEHNLARRTDAKLRELTQQVNSALRDLMASWHRVDKHPLVQRSKIFQAQLARSLVLKDNSTSRGNDTPTHESLSPQSSSVPSPNRLRLVTLDSYICLQRVVVPAIDPSHLKYWLSGKLTALPSRDYVRASSKPLLDLTFPRASTDPSLDSLIKLYHSSPPKEAVKPIPSKDRLQPAISFASSDFVVLFTLFWLLQARARCINRDLSNDSSNSQLEGCTTHEVVVRQEDLVSEIVSPTSRSNQHTLHSQELTSWLRNLLPTIVSVTMMRHAVDYDRHHRDEELKDEASFTHEGLYSAVSLVATALGCNPLIASTPDDSLPRTSPTTSSTNSSISAGTSPSTPQSSLPTPSSSATSMNPDWSTLFPPLPRKSYPTDFGITVCCPVIPTYKTNGKLLAFGLQRLSTLSSPLHKLGESLCLHSKTLSSVRRSVAPTRKADFLSSAMERAAERERRHEKLIALEARYTVQCAEIAANVQLTSKCQKQEPVLIAQKSQLLRDALKISQSGSMTRSQEIIELQTELRRIAEEERKAAEDEAESQGNLQSRTDPSPSIHRCDITREMGDRPIALSSTNNLASTRRYRLPLETMEKYNPSNHASSTKKPVDGSHSLYTRPHLSSVSEKSRNGYVRAPNPCLSTMKGQEDHQNGTRINGMTGGNGSVMILSEDEMDSEREPELKTVRSEHELNVVRFEGDGNEEDDTVLGDNLVDLLESMLDEETHDLPTSNIQDKDIYGGNTSSGPQPSGLSSAPSLPVPVSLNPFATATTVTTTSSTATGAISSRPHSYSTSSSSVPLSVSTATITSRGKNTSLASALVQARSRALVSVSDPPNVDSPSSSSTSMEDDLSFQSRLRAPLYNSAHPHLKWRSTTPSSSSISSSSSASTTAKLAAEAEAKRRMLEDRYRFVQSVRALGLGKK